MGGKPPCPFAAATIEASLAENGIPCRRELFGGISSRREIGRLAELAAAHGTNFIIALGGGAAIDAGKAVAHEMHAPVIVVPTTVATDAPCSALSVVYTEEGVFESYLSLRRNPDCVLVDTALVARSPAKFLVAGMGDAVAAFWESGTCARSGKANAFCGGQNPDPGGAGDGPALL